MTLKCQERHIWIPLVAFALIGLGLVSSPCNAAIPAAERQALIDLYDNTNGAGWFDSSGWRNAAGDDFNEPDTECSWYGVTCFHYANGSDTVIELVMIDNGLEGPLPASLGDLTGLEQLVLYSNNLSGPIPVTLGTLTDLTNLDLDFNRLAGPIPAELGGLVDLQTLWLDHNNLEGSIPTALGGLAQLTVLTLNDNLLEGAIPADLGNLGSLQRFDLSANRLGGPIPSLITKLTTLTSIRLNWNALSSDDPTVLTFLEDHWQSDWRDTQTVPPGDVTVGEVTRASAVVSWTPAMKPDRPGGYEILFATAQVGPYTLGTRVTGRDTSNGRVFGLEPGLPYYFAVRSFTQPHGRNQSTVLSNLSNVERATTLGEPGAEFFVSDTVVTEGNDGTTAASVFVVLAPAASGLVTVDWATADGTASAGPDYVSDSGTLTFQPGETEQIVDVDIVGDTEPEAAESFAVALSNPTGATVVKDTGECLVADDDPIPAERQALIDLWNGTNLGSGWRRHDNWRNPAGTDFNEPGTECSWWGVTCVAGRVAISEINLDQTGLFGFLRPSIGNLTHMQRLSLASNWNVLGPMPVELGSLLNLEELILDYNMLGMSGGTIPATLGGLTHLRMLSIIQNDLEGEIPAELGDLTNLRSLRLSTNQLSGAIPDAIGNLVNLKDLYLSTNQLSGSIPPSFGNLTDLELLYLGWNHLEGPIPNQIGNLANLKRLSLSSNKIYGAVPASITGLTSLSDGLSDVRLNGLYSDDPGVVAFLSAKQKDNDWQGSQTVAPANLMVTANGDHTAWLNWDPVDYTADPGGYEVHASPSGLASWTLAGEIASKSTTSLAVANLEPDTAYDFAIATVTEPHPANPNRVVSDLSDPVPGTTTNNGCAGPEIIIDWGPPIALSAASTHDGYLWSTGEITSSIELDIPAPQSYWVVATGPGSCEEADDIFVDVPDDVDLGGEFVAGPTTAPPAEVVTFTVEYSNHSGRTPGSAFTQVEFLDGAFSTADAAWLGDLSLADSRGNLPLLFVNQACELMIQLQGPDQTGIDIPGGRSGQLSFSFTMPMEPPGIGGLTVTSPTSLAGRLFSGKTACNDCADLRTCFGPRLCHVDPPVTAPFVVVDDASGESTDGCEALVNDVMGSIALIRRGTCEFGVKALNAENAGALAAVIMNDRIQDVTSFTMSPGSGGGSVDIPVVLIDEFDGDLLEVSFIAGEAPAGAIGAVNPGAFTVKGSVFHADGTFDPDASNDIDWITTAYAIFADSFESGDPSAWSGTSP